MQEAHAQREARATQHHLPNGPPVLREIAPHQIGAGAAEDEGEAEIDRKGMFHGFLLSARRLQDRRRGFQAWPEAHARCPTW